MFGLFGDSPPWLEPVVSGRLVSGLLPSDDWVSCVKDTHGAVRCGVAIFQVAALHDNCGVQIDYGDQGGTLFVLNGTAVSRQRPSDLVYHWCLYAGYCNDGSADAVTDLGPRVSVRVQQATLSSCLGYVCPPGYKEDVGSMAALYVRLNDTETCCTPAPPGHFAELSRSFTCVPCSAGSFKCAVDNSEASAGWTCYSVARHRSCRQCDHVRLPKRQLLSRFKFDGMRFVWTWFDLPRHGRSHSGCWVLRGFVSGCRRELVPLLWCQPTALSRWSSWLLR